MIWATTSTPAARVTTLRLVAFAINIALVAYLVLTTRLLGVRGGTAAYEARLRGESVLRAAAAADGRPTSQRQ